jgi:hypothetical protein
VTGYRLLLRAYPPGRRREELLDTLLDAGRGRPTFREAANLFRHGMRARLGRPASSGVVVLAVLIALVTGFTGGALATRAAWELVPGYPTGADRAEITGTIFPGIATDDWLYADGLFFDVSERSTLEILAQGHNEDFEFTTLDIFPATRHLPGDYPTWTAATQGRLVTAGWTVSDAAPTGPTEIATGNLIETGRSFTATRDGLALTIESATDVSGTPAGSFDVTATLDRLTPWYVNVAAFLGILTGILLGWLLTGWTSRRTEPAGTTVRVLCVLSSSCALVLLLPQALAGFLLLGFELADGGPPVKPFWTYSVTYAFGCALLGALLLLIPVLTATAIRRSKDLDGVRVSPAHPDHPA